MPRVASRVASPRRAAEGTPNSSYLFVQGRGHQPRDKVTEPVVAKGEGVGFRRGEEVRWGRHAVEHWISLQRCNTFCECG